MNLHTFVVHVENKPGVLTRVSGLIRRRGFNIESLTVGHAETEGVSRMTIVVSTDDFGARRVESNLYKLIDVLRVDDITNRPAVTRDLALVKVAATRETRVEIMQLAEAYRARIVDVAPNSLIVEVTGAEEKVDSMVEVLQPYGVLELARTGRVTMARGAIQEPEMTRDFEDGGRNVSGEDANIPGGSEAKCFVGENCQCVSFLAGRTGRAPDVESFCTFVVATSGNNLRDYHLRE